MTKRGWLLFIALGLIWGVPYLMIRVAVRELDPVVVACGRTVIGALILLPIALRRKALAPVLRAWPLLLVYSVIEIVIPWWLIGAAEIRLTSATAALLLAATPLFAAVLAWRFGNDRMTMIRIAGLGIGFAGVAALVGFDVHFDDLWSVAAVLAAAIGYAGGAFMIGHQLRHLPPIGVIAGSLLVSSIIYLPLTIWRFPTGHVGAAAIWSVIGLALLCTVTAFLLLFALVAEVGAARTTVITYINPLVAIVAGILVLNEQFTVGVAIGFVLVVIGAIMATTRERAQPSDDDLALAASVEAPAVAGGEGLDPEPPVSSPARP